MDEMGAALAHELNQPLTAIMLYLQAATRTLARAEQAGEPPSVKAFKPVLEKAVHEAERALREADDTTLAFDPTYGYPSTLSIDWQVNAADEEQAYTASNLVPAQ
jgi:hypothetical protein